MEPSAPLNFFRGPPLAIETASYISDLNISNPPGSDPVGQADDHIRLLKSVLKSTFPNVTGAISSTQAQLNYGVVPTGAIIMWSGATTSIPTGWALCDGGTYSKTDGSGSVTVPNLRDRFIVGAGSTYAVSVTGGATSNTPTITMSNAAYTLTQNDLPAYNLTVTDPGHNHTITDPGHLHGLSTQQFAFQGGSNNIWSAAGASNTTTNTATTGITINNKVTGISVNSAGGGLGHTHTNTATSSSVPTLPPYYALCFIYKL